MKLSKIIPLLKQIEDYRKKELELFFVLAMIHAKNKEKILAKGYAEKCLAISQELGLETMEDCATSQAVLSDIILPEFLHEGTIKETMKQQGVL